jgi:hypothetical protein
MALRLVWSHCELVSSSVETLDVFLVLTTVVRWKMEVVLLSKQLEWYSRKNLVLDFVIRVATQFMNLIPP